MREVFSDKELAPDLIAESGSLEEILGDDLEGLDDYATIEDLASSSVFSIHTVRREFARLALDRFMGTKVNVFTVANKEQVHVYISLNGIEQYLRVNSYPNINNPDFVESEPSQRELDAYWKLMFPDDIIE